LSSKLNDIQLEIDAGRLYPNLNIKDHVFHVIVGAGHHSKGNPVLKGAVNSWLS
jgi:hypothetical protein